MGICSSDQEGPINPHQVDASHFSMMKVVGKGGFGKVNAVTHRISGRLMAMKRMKKAMLLKKKIYVVTAWRERDVMAKVKSPFLVNLEYAFQDKAFLYILMPFMQGGDLRYYLNTRGRMNEEICRFYAVEMILGLEELHSLNILYRDLKPDNVLFDSDGHLRVSDFGLAVFLRPEDDFKTQGAAGTPGYQAPEVLNRVPYGFSADVWSLAITIYELLEKSRPFHTQDDVLSGSTHLYFEERISSECKDFISRLLIRDPHKRYGCGKEGIAEIKRHPWFKGINWKEREEKKVSAPFLPDLDRANCSADFELADQFLSDKKEPDINEEDQTNFSGFEYNVNPPSGTTFEIPNEKKKK